MSGRNGYNELGAFLMLCGRLALLHRASGCYQHPGACLHLLGDFIVPPCGANCKGFFALWQERQHFARRSESGPPSQRGGVAAAEHPSQQQRPPRRGGRSPSLTAVVRASVGDVPVARSRSAVRPPSPRRGRRGWPVTACQWHAVTGQQLPAMPGAIPLVRGGWRQLALCSSPHFRLFFVPKGKMKPKCLRRLGSGIFPSRKKPLEKWEKFSYFSWRL